MSPGRRSPIAVELLPEPRQGPVTADGPLRSIQEAELTMSAERLRELWTEETLERLGRAYWRHLGRSSLGLIRVLYSPTWRSVVLVSRRLELLRFGAPRYRTEPGLGRVSWRIEGGMLVARGGRGRGELRFEARRLSAPGDERGRIRISAVVENYYPLLRGHGRFARLGALLYSQTQLRIHRRVARSFLRSLERGELPELRPERAPSYERPLP